MCLPIFGVPSIYTLSPVDVLDYQEPAPSLATSAASLEKECPIRKGTIADSGSHLCGSHTTPKGGSE